MKQKQIASWGSQLPLSVLHVVQCVDFLLDVPIGWRVEYFRTWRRSLKLGLSSCIVVIVMLAFVIYLVKNVLDRIGKGVQILRGVLFGHERVILSLFKSDLDGNYAPM